MLYSGFFIYFGVAKIILMKRLLPALFLLMLSSIPNILLAQQDHRMSPAEQLLMPSYLNSRGIGLPSTATITPPNSSVRTIGEWEELQGLLVTWVSYTTMVREIIRAAQPECNVYVVCSNPTTVINTLLSNNIDTAHVICLTPGYNSVWCRDYGPWSAYTNDVDTLITIDWTYNRPRPLDDLVPVAIATELNTPLYSTTNAPWQLIHTGGNFMTDGFGTGFSSNLILNENPSLTSAQVDTIMQHFMGINRYIKMTTLPYDAIHHIDMHMKLLDEETILMGEYPPGIADGPQIEANLLYVISNYNSVYGTPYKVVRIPMPADNGLYPSNGGDYYTYTNSSFINKTIIVPTYGIPEDALALQIYRDNLPGYNVVGINSSASIGALGALHCITKELGTDDPLLISHQALPNTTDTVNDYIVMARMQHRSGIATATLYYRTDTLQLFSTIAMNSLSGQPNMWGGLIPHQSAGTRVYYYIEANATSGKSQVRPMPAPAAYWKFDVTGITGIENAENSINKIKAIFPNPCKGITCIPFEMAKRNTVTANLYDLNGRKIINIHNGMMDQGEQRLFMDTAEIPSGIYLLKITIGEERFSVKVAVR
ncbi:hypothetical protein BH11BAC2_BH11BAC2_00740 [soil metagenome]